MGYTVSESLNLPVVTTPARTLNSAGFQPNLERPCLVTYSIRIDSTLENAGGEEGLVELMSDAASTPTIVRVSGINGNTGTVDIATSVVSSDTVILTYLVPAGDYVRLITTNLVGNPDFTLIHQTEIIL